MIAKRRTLGQKRCLAVHGSPPKSKVLALDLEKRRNFDLSFRYSNWQGADC
jgi:hypothetical protein